MTCNCNPNFHKVTNLTATANSIDMTVTNSTNISSLDYFELVLCVNPNSVVTGAPLPFRVSINGTEVSLLNKYSLPIFSDRLRIRKRYYGSYVVPTTGSPYVILWNTPGCAIYAVSGVTPAVTTTVNTVDTVDTVSRAARSAKPTGSA